MDNISKPDFRLIFTQLWEIMSKYAGERLQIRSEKPNQSELVGPPTARSMGREVWFGAVRIGKRYVSYHIMAVYAFPDLLDGISSELKKRMQRGYQRFIKEGLIQQD